MTETDPDPGIGESGGDGSVESEKERYGWRKDEGAREKHGPEPMTT